MSPEVIASHAETTAMWAEQWSRVERPGAGEIAFLLARVARLMRGDLTASETPMQPLGGIDLNVLEEGLPPATVESEIRAD